MRVLTACSNMGRLKFRLVAVILVLYVDIFVKFCHCLVLNHVSNVFVFMRLGLPQINLAQMCLLKYIATSLERGYVCRCGLERCQAVIVARLHACFSSSPCL